MPNSQEKESQNRMDSIIELMMEEAKSVKQPNEAMRIAYVFTKVKARLMEIIRIRNQEK